MSRRDRTFDCMDGSFDSQSALFDSCTSSLIQLADVLRSQRVDLHSIATNEAFSKPIHSHIFRSDGNNDDMFWQASLPDLLHPKQEYRYQVDKLLGVKKATSMALALSLKQECEEMAKRELAFKTRFNHDQPVDTDFFITKVMPRMLFSQEDALFTALYLQRVGQDQLVLEAIFSREFLLAAFFPATHRELQCLGIFLAEMLVWAKAILNSNEEDEGVLKSYSKLLVDLVLDAMKCMNEDVLVSHAFQLTMYLVNREGGLFPSHLDVVEYFIKLLEEDVLLTFAFIERNNLLLQKLRRRITAETPTPSTSVPPSNTLSTEEESEKTSTPPAPPLTTPPPAVPVAPVAKPAASVKPAAPVTLPPHLARRNADNKQPPKKESPPPVVAASSSSVVAAKGKEPPRVLPLQNKGQAKQPAQRGGSSEEPVVRLQPREEQSSSSRSGRGGGDAKNEPRARHDEPFARGTQDPKDFKRGDSRREDSKREDPKDARREDPKDSKRDDPKDSKREDPKDSKREDPKDSKREDPKDSKREDPKDSKREDPKDSRREDPKDSRREDSRRDDFRREDNRRDDSKREDNRRDDSKREDNRRDDSKREDNRRNNDPRRDDSRRGSVEKQPSRNRNRSPPRPPPPPPPAPTAASNRNRSPQRSNKRYREEDEREQSKRNRRG
ncbi:hypothetical protein BASA81_003469 [Batrachochytrium salamandrivorans]|nr:hypothetical protein BASA81_003469 [Batrachochytrium salamandrivorans]